MHLTEAVSIATSTSGRISCGSYRRLPVVVVVSLINSISTALTMCALIGIVFGVYHGKRRASIPWKRFVMSRSSLSCGMPLRRLLKDVQVWLAINFL